MSEDEQALASALRVFIDAINATGGVEQDDKGYVVPVADPEWIDLGDAYVKACLAVGVEPLGDV